MNRNRLSAILCIALGMAGVSVALGLMYTDYRERYGAWIELTQLNHNSKVENPDQEELLAGWRDRTLPTKATIYGTVGVALLGAGCTLVIFELPFFNRPSKPNDSD